MDDIFGDMFCTKNEVHSAHLSRAMKETAKMRRFNYEIVHSVLTLKQISNEIGVTTCSGEILEITMMIVQIDYRM